MEDVRMNGMGKASTSVPTTREKTFTPPVLLIIMYVIAEYAKPEFLKPFHPAILAQSLLLIFLVFNVKKLKSVTKDKFFFLFAMLLVEMALHGPTAANTY